jgi:hypothetical protein
MLVILVGSASAGSGWKIQDSCIHSCVSEMLPNGILKDS